MIYTDFSVKNYRGIRQCALHQLELVNLFLGRTTVASPLYWNRYLYCQALTTPHCLFWQTRAEH